MTVNRNLFALGCPILPGRYGMRVLPETAFRVTCLRREQSVGRRLFDLVFLVMPGQACSDLLQTDILTAKKNLPYSSPVTIFCIVLDNDKATGD